MEIYRPLGVIEMEAGDTFDWEDNLGLGMIENADIILTATGAGNFGFTLNGITCSWGIVATNLTLVIPYNRMLRNIVLTSAPAGGMMYFVLARRPVS